MILHINELMRTNYSNSVEESHKYDDQNKS